MSDELTGQLRRILTDQAKRPRGVTLSRGEERRRTHGVSMSPRRKRGKKRREKGERTPSSMYRVTGSARIRIIGDRRCRVGIDVEKNARGTHTPVGGRAHVRARNVRASLFICLRPSANLTGDLIVRVAINVRTRLYWQAETLAWFWTRRGFTSKENPLAQAVRKHVPPLSRDHVTRVNARVNDIRSFMRKKDERKGRREGILG